MTDWGVQGQHGITLVRLVNRDATCTKASPLDIYKLFMVAASPKLSGFVREAGSHIIVIGMMMISKLIHSENT